MRFYRQSAASTSGSVRNQAFSAVIGATHRLLRAEAPRDVEILANIIEPEVMKSAVSAYDLGTGPAPKGILRAEDVREMVEQAITLALTSHDADYQSLRQAAVASKGSPLVLEDPALAGKSATEIAAIKGVDRRTVFRWRKDLKNATPADRRRWSARTSLRQSWGGLKRRYERLRAAHSRPRLEVPPVEMTRTIPDEFMNLLNPVVKTYPKMTLAGMRASLGASAA